MSARDGRARLVVLASCVGASILGGAACRDARTAAPAPGDGSVPDARHVDGGPPPPEDVVRVATWNVHRYFDRACDSATCGGDAYEELPDEADFGARTREIARAIERLDSDVVLLQEVESQACLDALVAELDDAFADAVLGEIGTPASVDVAVISRFPVTETRTHRHVPIALDGGGTTTFARELLEVHVDSPFGPVVVFAAHFRSMVDDDPARRIAEARAAAAYVEATARERPDAIVVLGGDLNDVPGSDTLAAIERSGALERVARELDDAHAATYDYFGQLLALDHLYVDTTAAGAPVQGSVRVRRDSSRGLGGSDHAALVADFHHAAR